MMSFNDLVHKKNLKKATTNEKTFQVLSLLYLNDVGIYLRDRPFSCDVGIAKLHSSKITHWVAYINEFFF